MVDHTCFVWHGDLSLQVKESVGVPVVANGDIRSEADVERVRRETLVDGECRENTGPSPWKLEPWCNKAAI